MPAIDKAFDYLVPEALGDQVRVGTMVRISLHGRRVGGWVVVDGVEPPEGVALKPVAKVTGWGPSEELVSLSKWAAWRWAGRAASFLATASPPGAVRGLPAPPPAHPPASTVLDPLAVEALDAGRAVLRLPPAADPYGVAAAAAVRGNALVVAASVAEAALLGRRLERAGLAAAVVPREWAKAAAGGCTVLGARSAAWAPVPELAAVVVLDAHDEGHQEERSPTWHARDVAMERARRAGVPCVLVSSVPPLELGDWGVEVVPARAEERAGWAALEIDDRRGADPRTGLYGERLASLLRAPGRMVAVLNRKGRARLLACVACGELARCERCSGAMAQTDDASALRCRSCAAERPPLCASCGAQRLKLLRVGVTRVREELEALVGEPVAEVTGETDEMPATRVVVGTEAVLHRLRAGEVAGVAFVDFDQELLAPRYRAGEQALALLARASRLVGGRAGRVLVQTRMPESDVLAAALHADPRRLADVELPMREALRFPPFAALALVSGDAAEAFVGPLDRSLVEVLGPDDGRWLVRAPDHDRLCTALRRVERPPGRLRVEVDPLRI